MNCSTTEAGWCSRKIFKAYHFLKGCKISQPLRNLVAQIIFVVQNFTRAFHRTCHFRTVKFSSLRNFTGHFRRACKICWVISQGFRKFRNPLVFPAKLLSPFIFLSQACELVQRKFPLRIVYALQFSRRICLKACAFALLNSQASPPFFILLILNPLHLTPSSINRSPSPKVPLS